MGRINLSDIQSLT